MKRVAILGAASLKRYSEGILGSGFREHGWSVTTDPGPNCALAIAQLHGAPHARQDDEQIIEHLLSVPLPENLALLIHRPDEIFRHQPHFQDLLARLPQCVRFLFLGDRLLSDPRYAAIVARAHTIPHGFFTEGQEIPRGTPLVGSHTSWGEMRDVGHALTVIEQVLRRTAAIGYLGGAPAAMLDPEHLRALSAAGTDLDFCTEITPDLIATIAAGTAPTRPTIILNPSSALPAGLRLSFNIQLYLLDGRVRQGENSGSLHWGVSVPTVFEMNGAEVLEDLHVIKVPYRSDGSVSSADLANGGTQIAASIASGEFCSLLEHNRLRAATLTPAYIAAAIGALYA